MGRPEGLAKTERMGGLYHRHGTLSYQSGLDSDLLDIFSYCARLLTHQAKVKIAVEEPSTLLLRPEDILTSDKVMMVNKWKVNR